MGYGAQSCEETASGQLLEVPLADVLDEKDEVNTLKYVDIIYSPAWWYGGQTCRRIG